MFEISKLKEKGYYILGIEQVEKSTKINDFSISTIPIAIVLGNEVNGVSQDVIDICDEVMEIPQFGTKHSLNISVATGIIIWELWRKINT